MLIKIAQCRARQCSFALLTIRILLQIVNICHHVQSEREMPRIDPWKLQQLKLNNFQSASRMHWMQSSGLEIYNLQRLSMFKMRLTNRLLFWTTSQLVQNWAITIKDLAQLHFRLLKVRVELWMPNINMLHLNFKISNFIILQHSLHLELFSPDREHIFFCRCLVKLGRALGIWTSYWDLKHLSGSSWCRFDKRTFDLIEMIKC